MWVVLMEVWLNVSTLVSWARLVLGWMTIWAGTPSRYVSSHRGQLSLAIPSWVGTVSASESGDINGLTKQCTSPMCVDSRHMLVSDSGLQKWRSAPPYGLIWLEKDFVFYVFMWAPFCNSSLWTWLSLSPTIMVSCWSVTNHLWRNHIWKGLQ